MNEDKIDGESRCTQCSHSIAEWNGKCSNRLHEDYIEQEEDDGTEGKTE